MKKIEIKSNSEILSATFFEGVRNDTILIIASATGVKQEYYQKFAQFIANNGISVLTFDYTGIGRSLKKPIKKYINNAADWGICDLESIIQYTITKYPKSKKIVLGHSIGGQLIGLSKASMQLDKIVLVAAQSGYWKYWSGIGRIKMWCSWHLLFPIFLNTFGYLKSKKISGMENLPKHVAKQWSTWGKNKDYILSDTSIHQKYYDSISAEVTAFSIEDDKFAPLSAVKWMTSQYKNAKKKSIHLKPIDFKVNTIGHFGIFKEKFKDTIWVKILDEIKPSISNP
ncbi:alpha/beta hydrolase family protein [Hyunsoonleella ulvae]|uniref:alpha/beta hydrolase family protein n=1 Tax=Hyunsoonleella ulvae TaxID=2799948 RepID=UPI00193AC8B5|nr:alpha/beta hydrolase [Hyunsoonleella ulvae]